jgi:hypothetical protein
MTTLKRDLRKVFGDAIKEDAQNGKEKNPKKKNRQHRM